MATKKATILNWSAGMTTSNRANSVEEFNSGFSLIKNFDIYSDPNVVKPVGDFERWNTADEEQYSFKGIGVYDTNIYATGTPDSSWYGNFQYRVRITPDFFDTKYLAFSLANMPSNFWTVMNTGAVEIRITNKDGEFVPKDTIRFNATTNTGFLVFPVDTVDEFFYIYYGNSTIGSISELVNTEIDRTRAYGSMGVNNAFIFDTLTNSYPLNRAAEITEPLYLSKGTIGTYKVGGTGHIGYALKAGSYFYDNPPYVNIPNDSSTSVAFTIEIGATYTGVSGNIGTVANYFNIAIDGAGRVVFTYDNETQAPFTFQSITSLPLNAVSRVVCTYEEGVSAKIYINGVLANTSTNNVSDDLDDNGWWIQWNVGVETVADIMYFNTIYSNNRALNEYNMLLNNASYYVVGSEETRPALGQYSAGCGLYVKSLTDSTWKLKEDKIPIVSLIHSPVIAPILAFGDTNIVFFTTADDTPSAGDFAYYQTNKTEVVDFNTFTTLTYGLPSLGTLQVAQLGIDNKFYVGAGSLSSLNSFTSGGVATNSAFDAYPLVKGIEDYNGYIAIAGDYKAGDKSYMQLWDRAGTQAIQNVNIGAGEAQVLGNLKGTLFTVVNNFIDNDNKSIKTQSMDVRVYTGGNEVKTTHRIDVPTSMQGYYTNAWDKPVSQLKGYIKNAVLFYAKITNDESGYTEGLWALGKNEITDALGLSLMYDTSSLGHVYNMATVGNQVILFHDSNKVSRLSVTPTYTRTSEIRTRIFNDGNSQRDKELSGVEIMHETLTGNQTIKVYKKNETDTDWVYLFESTASNQESVMSKEMTVDENGDAFGNFKEIEFKIESTGGSAGITQFAIKYETLNTIV